MVGLLTHEIKTKMAKTNLSFSIACLVAGLLIELFGNYIINPLFDSYVSIHTVQSVMYSSLCFICYYCYSKSNYKPLIPLIIMPFLYSFLLIFTINDTVYSYMRGIVWHNDINFLLFYRCVELFVLIRVIKDGKFIDWIRNTFINNSSSNSAYIRSNINKVGN